MILLGRGDQVNRQGYLVQVSQLLAGGKASMTDLERTAIVLTAMGYDVTNITTAEGEKVDLISEIMSQNWSEADINAIIFALLAVDSGSYSVDDGAKEQLISALLAVQNDDGRMADLQRG